METEDFQKESARKGCGKVKVINQKAVMLTSNVVIISSFMLLLMTLVTNFSSAAMSLPDGIEHILGFVPKSSFKCERDGYFGDIDNDCRLFHLCQKQILGNGRTEWRHWTYACGNQTMFNQLTLTCAFVDEAIPCKHATQFQYLNEVIHKSREPFLTDADVTSGFSYYNNRVMSDGARARAFEDSNLMAQLGGGGAPSTRFNAAPTATTNNEEVSIEDNSRAFNSIDANEELQASSGPTSFNSNQPETVNTLTGNNQLIINHQHHFQHNNNQQQFFQSNNNPTHQQDSQPRVEKNNFQQNSLPQAEIERNFFNHFSAPKPSATTQTTAAAAGQVQKFDFSISTNHQLGPAAAANTGSFVLTNTPAVVSAFQAQKAESVTLPPAPTTTLSVATTERQQVPTTTAISQPAPLQLVPTFSSVRASQATTSTTREPTTTQRSLQQPAQPSTTAVAPTTNVAPVVVESTTEAASRRRQANASARQQRAHNQLLFDGHMRGSFQSTRLNPLRQNNKPQESAILMRRQVTLPPPAPQAAAPRGERSAASAFAESDSHPMSFWKRTFEAQFLAPKFESMPTRRRV